mmetsp:Transcript_29526/g.71945  ORF Transcript_29526/g.71945 Transcript_29526/m.71945 type:complete len:87 (+) Transcript_29526:2581-2841(+)
MFDVKPAENISESAVVADGDDAAKDGQLSISNAVIADAILVGDIASLLVNVRATNEDRAELAAAVAVAFRCPSASILVFELSPHSS